MEIITGFILVFLSGFLNNYSGGGKFIQLPGLFLISPNLLISEVVGINKIMSLPTAVFNLKSVNQKAVVSVIKFIPVLLFGMFVAYLSTYLFLSLNIQIQQIIFVLFLGLGFVFSVLSRNEANNKLVSGIHFFGGYMFASFYEGVIGAGNGSIIMFLLKKYRGKTSNEALAISRVLTLGLMLGSILVFIQYTSVEWVLALPMAGVVLVGDLVGKMSKRHIYNPFYMDKVVTGLGFVSCLLSGYLVFS